ncbi:hypothetical protein JL721_12675 [Aureococcus anophagefferens]|nr:hypothetical protein JL721_12675 [Aureococcus anophagefferens]
MRWPSVRALRRVATRRSSSDAQHVKTIKYFAAANVAAVGCLGAAVALRPDADDGADARRIVARFEALGRGARLASTLAVVAADYKRGALRPPAVAVEAAAAAVGPGRAGEVGPPGGRGGAPAGGDDASIHARNAERLLALARANGGVYVKIAQHCAQLDYLLPEAYTAAFAKCLDDAPRSSWADVCAVVREELGGAPCEIFDDFQREPIASASLAQVHRATWRGAQVAVKLDFKHEAGNCARARQIFAAWPDVCVPETFAEVSGTRVLTMSFEAGVNGTARDAIGDLRPRRAAAALVSRLVILDHGLYRDLDASFRLEYARLWRALATADTRGIQASAQRLGVGDLYPLFAAMLTQRPWDDVANPDMNSLRSNGAADNAMLQAYAERYAKEITLVLDRVPRQMLLLLKMSDCLRHLDRALGGDNNTHVLAAHACADALFAEDRDVRAWLNLKLRLWAHDAARPTRRATPAQLVNK